LPPSSAEDKNGEETCLFPIYLLGVVLNLLSPGTILPKNQMFQVVPSLKVMQEFWPLLLTELGGEV
jgi:hypothetical protein